MLEGHKDSCLLRESRGSLSPPVGSTARGRVPVRARAVLRRAGRCAAPPGTAASPSRAAKYSPGPRRGQRRSPGLDSGPEPLRRCQTEPPRDGKDETPTPAPHCPGRAPTAPGGAPPSTQLRPPVPGWCLHPQQLSPSVRGHVPHRRGQPPSIPSAALAAAEGGLR